VLPYEAGRPTLAPPSTPNAWVSAGFFNGNVNPVCTSNVNPQPKGGNSPADNGIGAPALNDEADTGGGSPTIQGLDRPQRTGQARNSGARLRQMCPNPVHLDAAADISLPLATRQ